MNQAEIIYPPTRGKIWSLDVAASATGDVDFSSDFPFTINAMGASAEERVNFWRKRFISVRTTGEGVYIAIANDDSPTIDPAATGTSERVGVYLPDGQQMDFYVAGEANFLLIANGGTNSARVEVWPTSGHA